MPEIIDPGHILEIGIIKAELPKPKRVFFSFKYLSKKRNEFDYDTCSHHKFFKKLLDRFQVMTEIDENKFRKEINNDTYRCHQIKWDDCIYDNFGILQEDIKTDDCYQFNSGFNNGRVHGFFIDNIFYIVWIDENHRLHPTSR